MQKVFIKNRDNKRLAVVVENENGKTGLAFVMHGQGGFKEQEHIRIFVEAFLARNYSVVSFDTSNTIGESEGKMEDASITSYYADLVDVINWAKSQPWFRLPFVLAGHSLGGICSALYAEEYPAEVKALAPISTVVSGELSRQTMSKEELAEWERSGWLEMPSKSKPGLVKRIKWANMEDRLKYDLIPNVKHLRMPVLLIVGEKDSSTPPTHQHILFDALPGLKELHVIKGATHTFREKEHLEEVKRIFSHWITKLA